MTTVVAHTGDFEMIREFKQKNARTNPSLIYAATQKENHFLEEVFVVDHLLVTFVHDEL